MSSRLMTRAAWCGVAIALSGCGAAGNASPAPTRDRTHVAQTTAPTVVSNLAPTVPPGATSAPTPAPVTATSIVATVRPTNTAIAGTSTPAPATSRPVAVAAQLIAASIRPSALAPGESFTATVQTRGTVRAVDLYLGSGSPTAPAPVTYTMTETAAGSWVASGTAPAVVGQYHYTVAVYDAQRNRLFKDSDGWNIQVGAPAGSGTENPGIAQALPADVPLVPPFSYGNPVPAVFSAAGRSVNGSEISSGIRFDVPPAAVASFYESHLPRSGWSVDTGGAPAAGAASFTIVGTKTGRAVVVSYGSGSVHIFYGAFSG